MAFIRASAAAAMSSRFFAASTTGLAGALTFEPRFCLSCNLQAVPQYSIAACREESRRLPAHTAMDYLLATCKHECLHAHLHATVMPICCTVKLSKT
jgi:hypothetical protein